MTEATFSDDPKKFYGSASVQHVTGLAWSELVAMEARGDFPARVSGNGDAVWRRRDVDSWLESRDD